MNTELTTTNQNDIVLTDQLPLDQNPAFVYLGGLGSERSRRVQRQALEVIADMLSADIFSMNWAALRFQHTQVIRTRLSENYTHTSANRMLSALRGTLEAAWRLGQMSGEDYYRARDVKSVIGETLPAGRELSWGDVTALLEACRNDTGKNEHTTPAGIRDMAIIAVMYFCGLRRAEVAALDNYDAEDGVMVIQGKRNKQRTAYLDNGAKEVFERWLALRGDFEGPVFCPINKGGALIDRGMTDQAIYNMLKKRGDQAHVKDFSPHDLRRTFITHHLERGTDALLVSKMAGHASVDTTRRYDKRPEKAKQQAAGNLPFPNIEPRR